MSFKRIFLIIGLSIGLFLNPIQAQSDSQKPADRVYEDFGYKASIPLYQNKQKVSVEDMAKMANAYRLNHDTENAEFWYSQFIEQTKEPQHLFHYAQALQSNGKFDMENSIIYNMTKWQVVKKVPTNADDSSQRLLIRWRNYNIPKSK